MVLRVVTCCIISGWPSSASVASDLPSRCVYSYYYDLSRKRLASIGQGPILMIIAYSDMTIPLSKMILLLTPTLNLDFLMAACHIPQSSHQPQIFNGFFSFQWFLTYDDRSQTHWCGRPIDGKSWQFALMIGGGSVYKIWELKHFLLPLSFPHPSNSFSLLKLYTHNRSLQK